MNAFTKTLEQINLKRDAITEESGQRGQSGIIQEILRDKYPVLVNGMKSTKASLLAIWNSIISKAPRKYSRSWQKLFTALDDLLNILYSNESTRESTLTNFRSPIRDRMKADANFDPNIYTQSTHVMGITQARSIERKREYADKVKARNTNRGTLTPIYIEQIYDVIDKLIDSENVWELSIAVLLATGSRSVELYKVSKYEEIAGDQNRVRIIGLAKDKGGNGLENVTLTRYLVRLTAKQVVDTVKIIRSKVNVTGLTNTHVSEKTNRQLNKAFKVNIHPLFLENASPGKRETDEFKAQIKSLTSHKTRYISGNASYQIYGMPKQIPEETYLQANYGHLSGESTKSYLAVIVRFRHDVNPISGTVDLVPLENKVAELETKIEECCNDSPAIDIQLELLQYMNTFSRSEQKATKVTKVVNALKLLEAKKIKMLQRDLRKILKFSGDITTLGYKQYRASLTEEEEDSDED
jgi:hypothetical protein